MLNRQIPRGIDEAEFEQKIKFLTNFFGYRWLTTKKAKSSKLKDLWGRKDFLASRELYTIAMALQKFDTPENSHWLANFQKRIKNYDNEATISLTYELLAASLFYVNDQKVSLPAVGQPGYDFTVEIGHKTMRVSCKRLTASETEIEFYRESETLYNFTLNTMKQLRLNALQPILTFGKASKTTSLKEIKQLLLDTLKECQNQPGNLGVKIGAIKDEVSLIIRKVPMDRVGWHFFSGDKSLTFICSSPYAPNEQKRFENLFRTAASNLKEHSSPSEDSVNIIMIGLPVSVSLAQAKKWLAGKFEREYSSIAGVLLNRLIPAKDRELRNTVIVNERLFVSNPRAKVAIGESFPDGFMMDEAIAAEMVCENDSNLFFMVGDQAAFLMDGYVFQRGQIFHAKEYLEGDLRYDFPEPQSGISYHAVLLMKEGKSPQISAIYPPEDALIIL